MTLSIDWNEDIQCKLTAESLPKDMLERAQYAEYLTTYLKQFKNESYVFNINSSWGTGKTYFIKRWAESLCSKHPVVYFNSWKFDHNNEPLILILSEIIQQLTSLVRDPEHEEKKDKLTKSVTKTLKHIAPTLGKGIFKKVSGVNWDDLADEPTDEEKDQINFNSELVSISTQAILNLHTQQQDSIDELKVQISAILSEVLTSDNLDRENRWSPMYVFVDELDRCRPTFAIEVLEVIKHIFDIPRIIFVIATDTGQLQHSIKAVYGNEFDAEKYLMRFFNRSFSLPEPSLELYVKQLGSFELIKSRLVESSKLKIFEIDENTAANLIVIILEGYKLDLRSVNQILERIYSVLSAHPDELGVLTLLTLECLRVKSPVSFNRVWTTRITPNTTEAGFRHGEFIRDLNLNRLNTVTMKLHTNWLDSIFYNEKHKDVQGNEAKVFNSENITSMLVQHVNTSTRAKFNTNKYTSGIAYLMACMDGGEGSNVFKYKDYVELASNLS